MKLPKTYTEVHWERGGKIKAHKKHIGKPMISWSQVETWNSKTGFNTKKLGKYEYILKYFFGETFPDMGWGEFGNQVEDYICEKKGADNFTGAEKKVLDTIKPLGVFQREIVVDFNDFVLLGYIDDMTKPVKNVVKILRDYKTKSESSKKDLHKEDKLQIPLYVGGLRQEDLEVERAEYTIIERKGGRECMMGGGRSSLTVGDKVWTEEFNFTQDMIDEAFEKVKITAQEIAEHYEVFLEVNV